MNIFKQMINSFSKSLFVNFKCLFCGEETINESNVCPKCEKKVKALFNEICDKCGALEFKSTARCVNCFDKKYYFLKHRSCFIYDDLSASPVKLLKYEKRKYYVEPIAKIMFAFHREFISNVDYITFVPMTEDRKRNRGYNQSEELAKCLSAYSGIQTIDCLCKVKSTTHQADLNFDQRMKNLKDSFSFKLDYCELVKGKNILVVDDVFTTGSTMNECARVLLKAKVKNVYALTFLKTHPFLTDNKLPF